ncbi:MAG: HNH endonuclease [Opitutaceae bacterium]|nr:HNH endonuclease [Opitutaceae bacterium]
MSRVAAFARNHRQYLEDAAAAGAADPSRLITFRSSKSWRRIKQALDEQDTAEIYFAPIGGAGNVEYEAVLKALVLKPKKGEPETEAALAWALPKTSEEGLWESDEGKVRTLYLVSHCRRLTDPYPTTELVKVSDQTPISADYGYSYVPVEQRVSHAVSIEGNPEEIAEPEKYYEGAVKTVAVNVYERNPAARAKCIEAHGFHCSVCNFEFEKTYGSLGAGFIHVHHLTPLAAVMATYLVDPVKDLRPICPNCHAMIHKRSPPFSIEELKAIRGNQGFPSQ